MRHSRTIGRALSGAALLVAIAALAIVLLGGRGESYVVKARFQSASQLVKGNEVQVAGTRVGTVEDIRVTDDGLAEVKMNITGEGYKPLRRGTEAVVRLTSLTGVANRYVDLRMPPAREGEKEPETIPHNGELAMADTTSAVDLDHLFNTFDKRTRKNLQGVIKGFGRQYQDSSKDAERGWLYLNPSLAASSRLFEEVNRDTPALERFITENSKLVTDVAERRRDLAGLISELADTTQAIGSQKESLADAIHQLPPFMRRANTTFVNLRAALDDVRPLVRDSKPVARRLRPFFAELRPLARGARPTIRDLSRLVRAEGKDNDLIDLTRTYGPLRDTALRPVQANGKEREPAFTAAEKALRRVTPQAAHARPYLVDMTGWFDDFSHTGVYDALGGTSRVGTYVNAVTEIENKFFLIPPELRETVFRRLVTRGQMNRCPGAAEHPASDKSNPWRESPKHNCDPTQVLPGE